MPNLTVRNSQFPSPQEVNGAEGCETDVLKSNEFVLTQEEKEYQHLVSEKLKASVEWDVRDSKVFSIR